jgi:hypothetical protein
VESSHVSRVDFFGLAAPGIPGEEGKGIGPDAERGLPHGRETLAAGQMTSDV